MAEQYKYLDSFTDEQRANGKYSFTTEGLHLLLDVSENALKKSLQRLKSQEAVAMVRRGFYVIVPPEYKAKGIIPTSLYVNDLMKFLRRDYYVALLNAAAYYGAAHQQPQSFSIITTKPSLRDIAKDNLEINFIVKKGWSEADIIKRKVDTGYINVSSPELTALDLVHYYEQSGGLNRVASVLEELTETMKADKLLETASRYSPVTAVQRLGFLLDGILGIKDFSEPLKGYLNTVNHFPVLLRPQKEKADMITGNDWKVVQNMQIDID
jgi:predicted transcriptional regulator of viral defense system